MISQERIALFPGSFDPFTIGHESIVNRGLNLFDKIIIAIGHNTQKPGYFKLDQRQKMIRDIFREEKRIEVTSFTELTVDFCKKSEARYILRGLRTAADFEYERAIAQINKRMDNSIESVFLLTTPEHTPVTSTIVRDIIIHNGDASKFIPSNISYKEYL
jgi:pantetheine-phosphate adenylyltransferase